MGSMFFVWLSAVRPPIAPRFIVSRVEIGAVAGLGRNDVWMNRAVEDPLTVAYRQVRS